MEKLDKQFYQKFKHLSSYERAILAYKLKYPQHALPSTEKNKKELSIEKIDRHDQKEEQE